MSGEITDVDVRVAVEAYETAVAWHDPNAAVHPLGIRAALKSFAIAQEPVRPMHEPVTNAEIDDFMRATSDPYKGNMTPQEVTGIALDSFLACRAAATRAEVVVTEEDVCRACHAWQTTGNSISEGMSAALQTFADRLNGKHASAPVDPRVEVVRDWLAEISLDMVFEESRKTIEELLAKLDEVKP